MILPRELIALLCWFCYPFVLMLAYDRTESWEEFTDFVHRALIYGDLDI